MSQNNGKDISGQISEQVDGQIYWQVWGQVYAVEEALAAYNRLTLWTPSLGSRPQPPRNWIGR